METGHASSNFRNVLSSDFEPPMACDPYTTLLLCHLYCPAHILDIPSQLVEEYSESWWKAREATSSSPLGIHFGHYMAGTFNPEILIFNATMADIPLNTGYAPARWCKGLNVMIEKTPSSFNVEKLHIILLFEADFNSNNKWLGHVIKFNAKTSHLMAAEQYGSRKNKSAIPSA